MTRSTLPARRPSETICVTWSTEATSFAFDVTVGFDPATGRVAEFFYSDGMKSGAQLQATVQDTCIVISIALQHGATLSELGKSLGSTQVMGNKVPASIIGAILSTLALKYET